MQLASMVHASGRDREVYDHRQHQQHFYAHQNRHHVPTDVPQPPAHHYPQHQHHSQQDYHYRAPQSPPSPPVEEAHKPSLPSISSLLGIADGDRANSETAGMSPHQSQQQQQPSPSTQHPPQNPISAQQPESRPEQTAQAFGPAIVSNPRMTLPPTPPMQPESVVDGNQSPSAASTQSSVAPQPYYLGQSLNNMEPHQQRQHVPNPSMIKRHSLPSQQSMSPYNASPYVTSPYASSPGAASTGSFYSPETHPYPAAGMYQQRPLPSNFAPQQMPMPVASNPANPGNLWQHHHYISQSSQSAFPQSPDRYICPTCNKAFSRPSSLRIHSHSHTGEKPYKCPQPGCGKAFSVRSNMKRHERGCHAAGNVMSTS